MKTYYGSTEVQPGLLTVATKADRDAIPTEDRFEQMNVLVRDTQTTYGIRNDLTDNASWYVVKQGACGEVTNFRLKIHVSNTGNDDTGDGTQAKPFATVAKALAMAPDRWSDPLYLGEAEEYFDVTIAVAAGTYSFDSGYTATPWWKGSLPVRIEGEVEVLETITISSITSIPGKAVIKNSNLSAAIATTIDNDEDYYLKYDFGGGYYFYAKVLSGSTANTLKTLYVFAGQWELVKLATIFDLVGDDLAYSPKSAEKRVSDSIASVKIKTYSSYIPLPFTINNCSIIGAPPFEILNINSSYFDFQNRLMLLSLTDAGEGFPGINSVYFKNGSISGQNSSFTSGARYSNIVFDNCSLDTGLEGSRMSFWLGSVDVINTPTFLNIRAPDTSVSIYGAITLENVNTFAYISQNGSLFRRPGGFVSVQGATNSTCIIIEEGTASLIKSATSGLTNATNPGEEIIVGQGNSPVTFASLPLVDINTLSKAT